MHSFNFRNVKIRLSNTRFGYLCSKFKFTKISEIKFTVIKKQISYVSVILNLKIYNVICNYHLSFQMTALKLLTLRCLFNISKETNISEIFSKVRRTTLGRVV